MSADEPEVHEVAEQLRRERELSESVLDNSIDVIFACDRDLRITVWNTAAERLTGVLKPQAWGQPLAQIGGLFTVVGGNAMLRRVLAGDRVVLSDRSFYITAFGVEATLEVLLTPLRRAGGSVEAVLGMVHDVTRFKRAEAALRASESRYRQQATELELVYRTAPVGLCVFDTQLRFVHINARLAEISGAPVAAHLGKTPREVVPAFADAVEPVLHRVLATGEPLRGLETSIETRAHPDAQRTVISDYWPMKGDDGTVFGINVVVEEITVRKRLEESREREREFRTLAENSADVVARVDRARRLRYINPAIEHVTGRPREWFLGKPLDELGLKPKETTLRENSLRRVFEEGRPHVREYRHGTPAGERHFQSQLIPEFGPDGHVESVLVVDRDITDLKQAQQALERLTLQDPLTGVANRRYLEKFIEREWRREARHHHSVAVIMADIDYFKAYNDRYGHQQGDLCLQQVAQALKSRLRRPTDLLVRYGGEEFAVVLLETELTAAAQLSAAMHEEEINQRLPHAASPVAPVVTMSFGVAAAPAHMTTFSDLLSRADAALYRAKQNGRNRVEALTTQ